LKIKQAAKALENDSLEGKNKTNKRRQYYQQNIPA
jgi:hypothetical protein